MSDKPKNILVGIVDDLSLFQNDKVLLEADEFSSLD